MSEIQELPIGKLKVGEHEQRLDLADEGIEDLARSISRLGLLVPLHVKPDGDTFTVICGHRRFRAARKAGMEKLPCIVVDASTCQEGEISFAENFFRRNLSALELACAIQDSYKTGIRSIKNLAEGFHRSEHWVQRQIAICSWPSDVQQAIHEEQLSVSAASNLALVTEDNYRKFLVTNAIEQGATARTTASWLQAWRAMQPQEEAITSEPVDGRPPPQPAIPQAPCLCCGQMFKVNEMSHVPVCGACVQIIRQIGISS